MGRRRLYYSQLQSGAATDFRSLLKSHSEALREEYDTLGLTNVDVFICDLNVCVYMESSVATPEWDWPASFNRYMETWPAEPDCIGSSNARKHRLAIPMIDIFHDGVPSGENRTGKERIGSIARLKPDMVSSYIFYHYQKQEESPNSFNESYMIGALGRILFSYHELPATINMDKRTGLLSTDHSPDNWHEVMLPHFEFWDGEKGESIWRNMDEVWYQGTGKTE